MGQLGRTKDGFYPDLSLNEAIALVKKIDAVGGSVALTTLAKIVGIDPRGAGLRSRVENLKSYGLVEENGGVKLTGLGRDVARGNMMRTWEAFVSIPLYTKLHEKLQGREVDSAILYQILYDITKADDDAISRRITRLKNNYTEALQYLSTAGSMDRERGEISTGMPLTSTTTGEHVIPSGYAVLEMDGFVVGVKKDVATLELLEAGVKSWVALWKKQLGAKARPRSEEKKPTEKKPMSTEESAAQ